MDNQFKQADFARSRRAFLRKTGYGLLAGAALQPGFGLAETVRKPNTDRYQSVPITTHEWYGDIEERLDFPRDWNINYIKMAGHDTPVLSGDDIRRRIQSPVGSTRLAEIAAGKKTAVVTFDDLTRPTPAMKIAPYVRKELNEAGIDDDHILFLTSLGTHELLSQPDARAKLGDEIVERCSWINHNIWDNTVDVGVTSFGNRIEINNYFLKADVKVTISGVKVHGAAGYGGGGKAIVPGICSFNTTLYNHGVIAGYAPGTTGIIGSGNSTMGAGKILHNELRLDMEEAARFAGVDFSVQIVYNGKREPVGVFAGDIREAHIEACRYANRHYVCTPARNADIVINNTYPQSRQGQEGIGLILSSVREGGSGVLIIQNPMGISTMHFLDEHHEFKLKSYWDTLPKAQPLRNIGQLIVFSQYLQKRDRVKFPQPNIKFAKSWQEVLACLEPAHKGATSVALYPYGGIQHGPFEIG